MKLKIGDILIYQDQVLKFLGYGSRKPPAIILRKLEEELLIAGSYMDPAVFLKRYTINIHGGSRVVFGKSLEIESSHLVSGLGSSSYAYLCLYTVGEKLEKRIRELSENDEMIKAMILDKIGVVALDYINSRIKAYINETEKPLVLSGKFFPAQSDFEVKCQKLIFNALYEEGFPVTISSHCQFSPIKTVAAILSVG